jgi:HD-GYP domain-containing protein (c-di-GMP phosphodiesterase class II)
LPAEILTKPIQLTEIEISLIQAHSQAGYDILKGIEFPWPIADIIVQHHERMDGSGYPQGLVGEEILIEARIIGVCDVVETMSSHRPYRPSMGIDKALQEIILNKGTLYDSRVVDACLHIFNEQSFEFSN